VSTKSGSTKKACERQGQEESRHKSVTIILLIEQPVIPHARSENGLLLQREFPHARIPVGWPFGGRSSYGINQTASYFSS
jgi:hypothetical protein